MKQYCFDMSGISNPLETMPIDIYTSMWQQVGDVLVSGSVAVTREIYDEMASIGGVIGDKICNNQDALLLEVGNGDWDWENYQRYAGEMQVTYGSVISELNGGRKNTIGLNDLSIIALAKTLKLPVVSMEARLQQSSETKKRIPEVCDLEYVTHWDFNAFLRNAGIQL